MKRTTFLAATAFAMSATCGHAEPAKGDPMAAFYGNTVTIAVPDAYYYARRYIDPDGSWREPRGSDWIRGVWRIQDGKVCSWQTEPAVVDPRHYCYAIVARKVGEEWTTADPDTGNAVIQKIEPGRD